MDKAVLGVKIDGIGAEEAIAMVRESFSKEGQFFVFTPNPEMLVKAHGDTYYRSVLNRASLSLCDGFGLVLAGRLYGLSFKRSTGTDFLFTLAEFASKENKTVFLLGAFDASVLAKARGNLTERFPGLHIVGVDPGPVIGEGSDGSLLIGEIENLKLLTKIQETKPDILVVGFGSGKQEKWIMENAAKLPATKVFIGVGGALDFAANKVPRAPLLMRKIGLEWLYRLYTEPRRFKRIFNATVVFSFLVFADVWSNRALMWRGKK